MVARAYALVFGAILTILGIAGLATGDVVFGLQVATLQDWVHLLTGALGLIAGLWVGYVGITYSRLYAQIFGVVYTLVAVIGFATGEVLALFPVGTAESIIYLVIGVVGLLVGFTSWGLAWTRHEDLPERLRRAA